MQERIKKISEKLKWEEALLWMVTFYFITCNLDESVINSIYSIPAFLSKVYRYVFYLFCIAYVLRRLLKYKFEKISLFMVIMGGLSLLIFVIGRQQYPLILYVILLALQDIPVKRIAKCSLFGIGGTFLFLLVLTSIKLIPDWTNVRETNYVRHSLGYVYPTIASTSYFLALIYFSYIKEKISSFEIIGCIIGTFTIYMLTDSKTGFILSILVIIVMAIQKNGDSSHGVDKQTCKILLKFLMTILPFALFCSFLIFCILYIHGYPSAFQLDSILSGRIRYTVKAINKYGISLFGKKIQWIGWGGAGYTKEVNEVNYNFVDNAYIQMMLDYGALFLTVFLCATTATLRKMVENGETKSVILIIILLIWAWFEPGILDLEKNIFLIYYLRAFESVNNSLNTIYTE